MLQIGHRPWRAAAIALGTLILTPGLAPVVSAAPAFSAPRIIAQLGDRSPLVAQAQRLLIAAGITPAGGADGIYGPGTKVAVSEFQRRRGLPVTGTIDLATATLLGLVPATPVLALGARGTAVSQMQQQLLDLGIAVRGGADGIYGAGTTAAVKAFQQAHGITASGNLDAGTQSVLAAAVAAHRAAVPAAPAPTPAPAPAPVAAPAPTPAPAPGLAPGAKGAAVVALQQQLITVGLRPSGGADGMFGPSTTAMVKAFQARSGLPANGIADQATLTALAAAVKAAVPTGPPVTPAPTTGPLQLDTFPLPPQCKIYDSFGAARSGGRVHMGIDIMAPRGTQIYAVKAGTIWKIVPNKPGSLSGNAVYLILADGTYFFYAHLDRFADGLKVGSVVAAGAVLGYVGSTGNAGSPHLHIEVHPRGGAAINPFPLLKAVTTC